jgi:2-methylcitrate dehydratase PrpD
VLEHRVIVDHFEGDAFLDPRTRALMQKVHVEQYTNPPPDIGDHYAVDLSITLRTGEKKTLRQERPYGRTAEDPTPRDRLKAKFESCAARALGAEQASRLHARLIDLDHAASVRDVMAGIEAVSS